MDKLLEKIGKYCKEHNISRCKLESEAQIGNGTISRWNVSKPNMESLEKLSKYTGIPMKELIE